MKLRTLKLRQDSREDISHFLAFRIKEVERYKSAKAISIHSISPNKFLILDSDGVLRFLHLHNSIHGPEFSCNMEQLTQTMRVRKLAVFPGMFTGIQPSKVLQKLSYLFLLKIRAIIMLKTHIPLTWCFFIHQYLHC